ncbi:MAG: ABC transporter permease [Chlamydiae bacterium]|nr:ABC transporter permease [Chlamydiota bacterium]MBI3265724.1 ABC transporter permease [Chlamydiota bacterium]
MKSHLIFYDHLKTAFQMVSTHRLRSLLSVVGIVFGVLTLMVTLSIGEGTRRKIMKTIEAMGSNLIYVSSHAGMSQDAGFEYIPLTEAECQRFKEVKGIEAYAPILSSAFLMQASTFQQVIPVEGTTPSYQRVRDLALDQGRFLADEDVLKESRGVVIGKDLAQFLFPFQNPLNQKVHLWDESFKVVGVLQKKGRTFGVDFDREVLMPLSTLQQIQGKRGEVQGAWIRTPRGDLTKQVMRQMEILLSRKDVEIWDQEALLSKKDRITRAFKWSLGSIALVSLLIGGIGVMNVLLVSVAERIREMGLRKAVGATSRDILFQLIFESVFLTLTGSCVGILLGLVTGDFIAWLLNTLLPSTEKWEAVFSWSSIGVAFHFSLWVGLLFGLYPAWKASRLDPCEALTYF